ncbi:MAG: acyltransferase family protein, partial [Erysipelotrichaceae bacterium]|nr:acyltransferase family protein [Erysipelotrichaceae bacterium]
MFDICVPIYSFLTGYGMYIKKSISLSDNLLRIFKLLLRFWIILILTCLMGFITNNSNIPGSIFDFISNFTLYKLSYVGAWWYLQIYVVLVLISPFIIKVVDKNNSIKVITLSLIIYFVTYYFRIIHPISVGIDLIDVIINFLVLFGTTQFAYVIGMMFYKYKIISNIRNHLSKQNIIGIVLIILCLILHIIIKSMIIAPFIAILFIIGFSLLKINKGIERILIYFNNHSTNIWLIHMQIY